MGKELTMTGTVDTIRGRLEPIGGRVFEIAKGQVQFTGGAPTTAQLDVVANYDNPAAKVKVNVSGPVLKPVIKMTSIPVMDEAQIAVLIATGRTELKAGGGSAELGATEAAGAVLGAVATQAFKGLLSDKLPVDTVSIDSGQFRVGKYVTDKIFLGYTHRFNAREELGENVDEGRFEYQIDPRWSVQATGGTAGAGGANILWSKDY
jgi:translocation and assembly module TamB